MIYKSKCLGGSVKCAFVAKAILQILFIKQMFGRKCEMRLYILKTGVMKMKSCSSVRRSKIILACSK
jgi:hypothetical protein